MDRLVAHATAWAQFICVVGAVRPSGAFKCSVYAFFMEKITGLLGQKIEDLPFSNELKSILSKQGHTCLQDVLNQSVKVWMYYDGFDYHCLKEIVGYVWENRLVNYLKH
jgi:methionine salvage enolase-phosphatase E1